MSLVHLYASTGMNREGLYAHILQAFGYLLYINRITIPPQACLDRYRQVGTLDHRLGKAYHKINVFENSRSCSLGYHFFDRTAEVNIHHIGRDCFHDSSRERHSLLITSKYLDTYRAFVIKDIQFLSAFYSITYKPFGGYKLTIEHIRPMLLTKSAKGRITYILHRSQE